MRITDAHRTQIRQAVKLIEPGRTQLYMAFRQTDEHDGFNLLKLVDEAQLAPGSVGDTDLYESYPLNGIRVIEDVPSGRGRIDVYVYGRGELLTNVVVAFGADGEIESIHEGPLRPLYTREEN